VAQTLYAAKGGNTTTDLYVIDPGVSETVIGGTGIAITGLAFHPITEVLYAVTSAASPAGTSKRLYTLDPGSGTATLVGGMGRTIPDIAFDSTGVLYGWSAGLGNQLCTIDLSTAAVTPFGSGVPSISGGGIAVDSGDNGFTAYENSPQDLETVDLGTAAVAVIGAMTGIGSANMSGLAFDDGDVLWGIALDSGVADLYTINTGSGAVSAVMSMSTGFDALAWGPDVPPPAPSVSVRFGNLPWRLIVGTVPAGTSGSPITTWAQGLWSARRLSFTLNQPAVIEASLVPDDPRVNTIYSDGFPFVSQSNRIVWAFQREGTLNTTDPGPWVCRGAGILMSPSDEGDDFSELTHIVAYDAWQYLSGRPVMDADGFLPVAPLYPSGMDFFATPGDEIIGTVLKNTIVNRGFAFIDAGTTYGGTAFYGGTIEPTPAIDYHVDSGKMVGEVWSELTDMGNCDIVLTPIYDPANRPGYTHELNVYNLAGEEKSAVVFAWDRFMRQVSKIQRQHDGTPGNFINVVQYFAGSGGGFPVPLQTNDPSIAVFLEYWSQQFFPAQPIGDGSAVIALASQALSMAKQGKRTMVLSPSPIRSPIPFLEYGLGDRVAVYTTDRLRVESTGYTQRVQAIPIEIDDDGVSHVNGLLCSPDWRIVV
jgi:hypothetical protein